MNRKSGRNDGQPVATPEDRKKYMEAWSNMMVNIWKEKIERLQVWDTWTLHQGVAEDALSVTGKSMDYAKITHSFTEYGIYQDLGVGRGFERGNGGDLGFHPVRQPRPWFSRAYFASVMVLKEQMAHMYGEEFCSLVANAVSSAEKSRTTTLRSKLWGTRGRR